MEVLYFSKALVKLHPLEDAPGQSNKRDFSPRNCKGAAKKETSAENFAGNGVLPHASPEPRLIDAESIVRDDGAARSISSTPVSQIKIPVRGTIRVPPRVFNNILRQEQRWIGKVRNLCSYAITAKPGDTVLILPLSSSHAPVSSASAGSNRDIWICCEVLEVSAFDSFESMVSTCGLRACQPGAASAKDAVEIFRRQSRLLPVSFRDMHTTAADDSPVDERAQGGVIGLKLRLRESRNSPADATSLIKCSGNV
jgi:hypothetical protein